jgi:cytochrome c peroxidase
LSKKFYIVIFLILVVVVTSTYTSCKKKDIENVPAPSPLTFTIPQGFPQPQYDFSQNPITQQGFDLGKKIFYDTRLSSNGQISCGNCHQQFASFVQFDHDLGHGVNDAHTTRNPQPLINLAWHKEMMWDGGINHLEIQPLAPFTATNEMNITIAQLVDKVNADGQYKQLFKSAFGDETVTSQRILKALSQFMLMLVTANSKYDQVKKGTTSFDALETLGYQVFQAKCNTCHKEPLFTDLSFRNIGLTKNPFLSDDGRMKITNNSQDSLKFKVPSLRNAALTFPYTHDGRIASLDQMIDHYRFNTVIDFSTDPLVRNRIGMSNTEKAGLIAFIKTLTDTSFTKDKRFSE